MTDDYCLFKLLQKYANMLFMQKPTNIFFRVKLLAHD